MARDTHLGDDKDNKSSMKGINPFLILLEIPQPANDDDKIYKLYSEQKTTYKDLS